MYSDLTIGQMYAFDFFTNVKNWMINKAVAPIEYKWNDLEDFTSVINDVKDGDNRASIEDHFKELITLPEDYLKNLGFHVWDETSEEYKLYLIPLWLFHILPKHISFVGSDIVNPEQPIKYHISDLDNDNRFGCLAYGIYIGGKLPKDSIVKDYVETNYECCYSDHNDCCEG